jgi:hypothetical protein
MFATMGLTDTFFAPTRTGQQDRLDNYGQVVSAGLVSPISKIRTLNTVFNDRFLLLLTLSTDGVFYRFARSQK